MLYTNLRHIESEGAFRQAMANERASLVVCGRMDEESIRFYRMAEHLDRNFREIDFYDLEIDNPDVVKLVDFGNLYCTAPVALLFIGGNLAGSFQLPLDEKAFKLALHSVWQQNIQKLTF